VIHMRDCMFLSP